MELAPNLDKSECASADEAYTDVISMVNTDIKFLKLELVTLTFPVSATLQPCLEARRCVACPCSDSRPSGRGSACAGGGGVLASYAWYAWAAGHVM